MIWKSEFEKNDLAFASFLSILVTGEKIGVKS
jgi:hypothetical protein